MENDWLAAPEGIYCQLLHTMLGGFIQHSYIIWGFQNVTYKPTTLWNNDRNRMFSLSTTEELPLSWGT